MGPHARQQLIPVNRAQQKVIDTDLQPAREPRSVVGLGNRKDRNSSGPLERTDLAAQTKAVEVLHRERYNDEVVVSLGGTKQRFVRIAFDIDDVFDGQCGRKAPEGVRPVVDNEHTAIAAGLQDRFTLRILQSYFLRGRRTHAQFVSDHFEAGQRTHAGNQRDIGHGLGEEVIGAGFQPAHAIGRLIEGRYHHDRDVVSQRIGLETAANLKTIQFRHHHIEQDDVARGPFAQSQRLGTAVRNRDVKIFRRETRFEQLYVRGHVVHDKDASGHQCTVSPRPGNGGWSR